MEVRISPYLGGLIQTMHHLDCEPGKHIKKYAEYYADKYNIYGNLIICSRDSVIKWETSEIWMEEQITLKAAFGVSGSLLEFAIKCTSEWEIIHYLTMVFEKEKRSKMRNLSVLKHEYEKAGLL